MKATLFLAGLAIGALAACDLDVSDHCDPGQVYRDFACYAMPDAAPVDTAVGDTATGTGGDAAGEGSSCAAFEGFGDTCTDASQCRCGLDYCNTYQGANYCTQKGCLENASICPTGWTCLDLTSFGMGSICSKP